MFLSVRIIARLNSLNHVCHLATFALHQLIVSNLHTIPALVTVHSIETTDDRSDSTYASLIDMLLEVSDEALARLRVSVTSIHEAVYIAVVHSILLSNIHELQDMTE